MAGVCRSTSRMGSRVATSARIQCANTGQCVAREGRIRAGARPRPLQPPQYRTRMQLVRRRRGRSLRRVRRRQHVGNDGCTERCKQSCDPATPSSCSQPMLKDEVPNPCRRSDCLPVDLDPTIENEGAACVTVALDCTGCTSDLECISADTCQDSRCEANRCVNEEETGIRPRELRLRRSLPRRRGCQCAPAHRGTVPARCAASRSWKSMRA